MIGLFCSNLWLRLQAWWAYQPPEHVSYAVIARLQRRGGD